MLRLVYKMFKTKIWELVVEDMFGNIPKDVSEPSLEFLGNGKDTLERFFAINAYQLQRAAINNPKQSDIYTGMLIYIKSLMITVKRAPTTREKINIKKTPDEGLSMVDRVNSFIEKGKNFNKKEE